MIKNYSEYTEFTKNAKILADKIIAISSDSDWYNVSFTKYMENDSGVMDSMDIYDYFMDNLGDSLSEKLEYYIQKVGRENIVSFLGTHNDNITTENGMVDVFLYIIYDGNYDVSGLPHLDQADYIQSLVKYCYGEYKNEYGMMYLSQSYNMKSKNQILERYKRDVAKSIFMTIVCSDKAFFYPQSCECISLHFTQDNDWGKLWQVSGKSGDGDWYSIDEEGKSVILTFYPDRIMKYIAMNLLPGHNRIYLSIYDDYVAEDDYSVDRASMWLWDMMGDGLGISEFKLSGIDFNYKKYKIKSGHNTEENVFCVRVP